MMSIQLVDNWLASLELASSTASSSKSNAAVRQKRIISALAGVKQSEIPAH